MTTEVLALRLETLWDEAVEAASGCSDSEELAAHLSEALELAQQNARHRPGLLLTDAYDILWEIAARHLSGASPALYAVARRILELRAAL